MNSELKQYIVFAIMDYPSGGGGLGDIHDSFDDLESARKCIKSLEYWDQTYIINKDTWEDVE